MIIKVLERVVAEEDEFRDVVPGDLLPELNLRLYRRVYEGS